MRDAAPQIPRAPQAGDHGEEVDRSPTARLREVPRGLPQGSTNRIRGTVSPGSTFSRQRTSPPPSAGSASIKLKRGSASSSVSGMEGPAEGPMGGGSQGDREVEERVECPGPPGRWAMQPGGTRLPLHYGFGKAGPD